MSNCKKLMYIPPKKDKYMKSNVESTTELFQDGSNKDSLETRKNRPVEEPSFGNCSYIVILVIMCVMAALFFALWIADLCTQFVPWNNNADMFNATGIICQVITALISCVVSVLGISFSIQDYEKFDTKIICHENCAKIIADKKSTRPILITFVLEEKDRLDGTNLLEKFLKEISSYR